MPGPDPLVHPEQADALELLLPVAHIRRAEMDRMAELAATVLDAPVGMVNLIRGSDQHIVGLYGLGEPLASLRRIEAEAGYCATTVRRGEPLYLDDAAANPEFAAHPAHLALGFVAYAGVPLTEDGELLGTLCVLDTRSRRWRPTDRRALEALAETAVSELKLHRDVDRRRRLLEAFGAAPAAIAITRGPEHVVEYTNAAYRVLFGEAPLGVAAGLALPELPAGFFALMDEVLATGEPHVGTETPVVLDWPGSGPGQRFFDYSYSPVNRTGDDRPAGLLIVAIDVTERVQARDALADRAQHQELIARASAALTREMNPETELRELAAAAVPELADLSTVHLLVRPLPPGQPPPLPFLTSRVAVAVAPGRLPEPPLGAGLSWDGDDPITAAIRNGALLRRPIATPVVPAWALTAGAADTIRGGLAHLVSAPVLVEGLVAAVVSFGLRIDRPLWTEAELDVLAEITRRAGTAVEHAMAFQRTRSSALTLQRSLLTDPPEVPGLTLAARYRPAGRDEVGGDWYDAFTRPDGTLVLVIGDVVGHDITAAAAMGQLRATLRSLALDRGDGPGAALDRLDRINTHLAITPFATLAHAHLARDGRRLCFANAGHPPPLLVVPGEPTRLLVGPGAALTRAPASARAEVGATLPTSATLVLYTDGLVERAGGDIDEETAAVARLAQDLARAPVDVLCDALLARAPDADDVALIAVRVG